MRLQPRIARRGIDASKGLDRHRWVAERTLAWLPRYRRLTIRYEVRDNVHFARLQLACRLILFSQLS
ncbi:transposase [Cystobacter fuscus]|uniref:Transposase n=1 Tax=Cystobacter fuscus TaxID=43 RepID=A0A250J4D2_9BACT|nr:transposase [Cystobacter fuscus]